MVDPISGGRTWYLQLRMYINCNSNHCRVATKRVVYYQADALSICNPKCTLIATRTTIRLQLKRVVQYQAKSIFIIFNSTCTSIATQIVVGCNLKGCIFLLNLNCITITPSPPDPLAFIFLKKIKS
jgi:hypothetical protein